MLRALMCLCAMAITTHGIGAERQRESYGFELGNNKEVALIRGMSLLYYLTDRNKDGEIGKTIITQDAPGPAGEKYIGIGLAGASASFDAETGCLVYFSIQGIKRRAGDRKVTTHELNEIVRKAKIFEKIGYDLHGVEVSLSRGFLQSDGASMSYPRMHEGLEFFDESVAVYFDFNDAGEPQRVGLLRAYISLKNSGIPKINEHVLLDPSVATSDLLKKAESFAVLERESTAAARQVWSVDTSQVSSLGLMHENPSFKTGGPPEKGPLSLRVHLAYLVNMSLSSTTSSLKAKVSMGIDAVTGEVIAGQALIQRPPAIVNSPATIKE